jgi:carbamoyltransferase
MYVLGINPGEHEGSACVVKNGEIISFAETDRISRERFGTIVSYDIHPDENQYRVVPTHLAVGNALRQAGLTLDDIDAIAIGWSIVQLGWTSTHLGSPKRLHYGMTVHLDDERFDQSLYCEALFPTSLFPRKKMPPVHFVPHHLSHASSGFFISGYEESAILVADGWGESEATSLFWGSGREINLIRSFKHSLGHLYNRAASESGFDAQSPGKLMGLAPYGQVYEVQKFYGLTDSGYEFYLPPNWTNEDLFYNWKKPNVFSVPIKYPLTAEEKTLLTLGFSDFAATVQHHFEKIMLHLVGVLKEETGIDNLVIAGGCGQNCTFNGLVASAGKEVFVPPVPHDTGVSLGSALYVERLTHARNNEALQHAYYGYKPSREEIKYAVKRSGLNFRKLNESELLEETVQHLMHGRIVGWYQGRAEIGARALGARSLLMDPRKKENWKRLNEVKGREAWRPLAPSILKERAGEFFDITESHLAKFMVGAFKVKKEMRDEVPAIVHVDGSARPQFVEYTTNPRYYKLIEEFALKTGTPMLVNTSFNLSGEPIVHLPEDAIRSFMKSEIDVLVLGDYIISKAEKPGA